MQRRPVRADAGFRGSGRLSGREPLQALEDRRFRGDPHFAPHGFEVEPRIDERIVEIENEAADHRFSRGEGLGARGEGLCGWQFRPGEF